MFALPGTLALIAFILARPFEFVPALHDVPFLHLFFAIASFGLLIDAKLGYIKLRATPLLGLAAALFAWCLVTVTVSASDHLGQALGALAIVLAVVLVVGEGLQSFFALERCAALVLVCSLWISLVCVHQALQPFTCVAVEHKDDHSAMGNPDGRECVTVETCYVDPPEPQALYRCERAGLLGITSIENGRVRYVGVLHDPNEVALAVSLAVPLSVAFRQRKRTTARTLLVAATVLLTGATVVLSQSRGGLFVFAAVLGVYFLHRYRLRGAILAAMAVLPLLALGGRSGARAESSTNERLETWYEGLDMLRAHPLDGVGHDQFTQHHHLTAHNSFLLAAAENGLLGLMLWTAVVYLALKIPVTVLRHARGPEAEPARIWALALLASLIGLTVGTLFLTFNYHYVLWIYFGMSAALWHALRRHLPEAALPFGWRDALAVAGAATAILGGIYVSSRMGG
jgi:O-antigen ligase